MHVLHGQTGYSPWKIKWGEGGTRRRCRVKTEAPRRRDIAEKDKRSVWAMEESGFTSISNSSLPIGGQQSFPIEVAMQARTLSHTDMIASLRSSSPCSHTCSCLNLNCMCNNVCVLQQRSGLRAHSAHPTLNQRGRRRAQVRAGFPPVGK